MFVTRETEVSVVEAGGGAGGVIVGERGVDCAAEGGKGGGVAGSDLDFLEEDDVWVGPAVEAGAEAGVGGGFGFTLGRGGGGEEGRDGWLGVEVGGYAIDVPGVDAKVLRFGLKG